MVTFVKRHHLGITLLCLAIVASWQKPARTYAGEPAHGHAQNEMLESDPLVSTLTEGETGDVLIAFQHAPFNTPIRVDSVNVWAQQPDDEVGMDISVRIFIWNGWGQLHYYSRVFGLQPGGLHICDLTAPGNCFLYTGYLPEDDPWPIAAPANLDDWEGPGYYVGVQYYFEVDKLMSSASNHVLAASQFKWPYWNLCGRFGLGFGDCHDQIPGNFGIRSTYSILCDRRGDVDWDGDIDDEDISFIESNFTAEGEIILGTNKLILDLNTDGRVNGEDLQIALANKLGSGNEVACPVLEILTEEINRVMPMNATGEPSVIRLRNAGSGAIDFATVSLTPWLWVEPASGTLDGTVQEIQVHFGTQALSSGDYEGWIQINANVGGAPRFIPVHLRVQTAGDLDLDGDVDQDDMLVLQNCVTGPAVSYLGAVKPPECFLFVDGDGTILPDLDRDYDVDQDDFGVIQRVYGTNTPYAFAPVKTGPTGISVRNGPSRPSSCISGGSQGLDPVNLTITARPLNPFQEAKRNAKGFERTAPESVQAIRDAAKAPLRAPETPEGPQMLIGWGILAILVIIMIAALLYRDLRPNESPKTQAQQSGFAFLAECRPVTSNEQDCIIRAWDYLYNRRGDKEVSDCIMKLGEARMINAGVVGQILVNDKHRPKEDHLAVVRTAPLGQVIGLHSELFPGNFDDAAKKRLAFVLLCEAQHLVWPKLSEKQCQVKLEALRKRLNLQDVAADIRHGSREYNVDSSDEENSPIGKKG